MEQFVFHAEMTNRDKDHVSSLLLMRGGGGGGDSYLEGKVV